MASWRMLAHVCTGRASAHRSSPDVCSQSMLGPCCGCSVSITSAAVLLSTPAGLIIFAYPRGEDPYGRVSCSQLRPPQGVVILQGDEPGTHLRVCRNPLVDSKVATFAAQCVRQASLGQGGALRALLLVVKGICRLGLAEDQTSGTLRARLRGCTAREEELAKH